MVSQSQLRQLECPLLWGNHLWQIWQGLRRGALGINCIRGCGSRPEIKIKAQTMPAQATGSWVAAGPRLPCIMAQECLGCRCRHCLGKSLIKSTWLHTHPDVTPPQGHYVKKNCSLLVEDVAEGRGSIPDSRDCYRWGCKLQNLSTHKGYIYQFSFGLLQFLSQGSALERFWNGKELALCCAKPGLTEAFRRYWKTPRLVPCTLPFFPFQRKKCWSLKCSSII